MNKAAWRTAALCDWRVIEAGPKELKADRDFMLEVVSQSSEALSSATPELKGDMKLVLLAVKQDAKTVLYATEELRCDREFSLRAVQANEQAIEFLDPELRHDRDFMLKAVQSNFKALALASEDLRTDDELILCAFKQSWKVMKYATPPMRATKEFMLRAVDVNWHAIEFASEELQGDRDLCLKAIAQNGLAIDFAGEELRKDRSFMVEAVKLHEELLKVGTRIFGADTEFWIMVVTQVLPRGYLLALDKTGYGPEELRDNRAVCRVCVMQNWRALQLISPELAGDPELVSNAVSQDWQAVEFATHVDLETMVVAVKQNWRAVKRFLASPYADADLAVVVRANCKVVRNPTLGADYFAMSVAVEVDGMMLEYASDELKKNESIVFAAVKQNWQALQYVRGHHRKDKSLVMIAINQDGRALQHCDIEFRADRRVVLDAMRKDVTAFYFAAKVIRDDPDFWKYAVRRFGKGWQLWLEHESAPDLALEADEARHAQITRGMRRSVSAPKYTLRGTMPPSAFARTLRKAVETSRNAPQLLRMDTNAM